MTNSRLLIVFMRNPVLGKTKTRLARDIGDKMAFNVYLKLLSNTNCIVKKAICDKAVCYSDTIDHKDIWDNNIFRKTIQSKGDLGERMENAFKDAFAEKYCKVVLVGTDCFDITTGIINEAFDKLETNDIVIGPAKDGGYYLIGMKKLFPSVFRNKTWSTDVVLDQTLIDIWNYRLRYSFLPQLSDIDTLDDIDNLINLDLLYTETIQK
ncbi:MAG: hypothetical protein B6D61_00450 [Bacteroidetes bacterium 4484_249]|nr:MAG: hypothetical protein B6D61_00450 [Bacteroidetes bacterium 4484_249]